MWLILDKADAPKDHDLAEHVLHVHRYGTAPQPDDGPNLTSSQLRAYVAAAKTFQPIIPKDLISKLTLRFGDFTRIGCRLHCQCVFEHATRES